MYKALFLQRGLVLEVPSHLPGINPAGFGTVPEKSVAGFHRASPSTSLDKSILTFLYFLYSTMLLIWCHRFFDWRPAPAKCNIKTATSYSASSENLSFIAMIVPLFGYK
jgi:hypothetical protein